MTSRQEKTKKELIDWFTVAFGLILIGIMGILLGVAIQMFSSQFLLGSLIYYSGFVLAILGLLFILFEYRK